MRQITKAITIICVMSSCGSTAKEATETLPTLQLAPVISQPVILNAHEALQEDLATTTTSTTTTTEVPLVSDPLDYIDESRAMYGKCGEWYDTLIAVGGRAEDWPIWSRVLWIESRCLPAPGKTLEASAAADCIGLTQIFFRVHEAWLSEFGFGREDLLDPVKNLTFAVALQKSSGWSPWAYLNMP
jgi:hypothetical protein